MMPALAESDLGRASLGTPTITTSSDHRGTPRLTLEHHLGTFERNDHRNLVPFPP
jgi:hypothetical protein